ncbi:MAG: TIGR00730 family Rossman fold protein [Burkholderiaceae bacterium]|jgi:uncharacterized protein (TIGR00730 family)
MTSRKPSLTVFCGSRHGLHQAHIDDAAAFGHWIGEQSWHLVYGGGNVGLMGEIARAALQAGAQVTGIIPESLMKREVGLEGLTRLEVVSDMAVRKQALIDLGDAFVVLPGGLGTLDEFFEVATLLQLDYHRKPIMILNRDGFWDPLLALVKQQVIAGFVSQKELDAWHVVDDLDDLKACCLALLGPSKTI